MRSASTWDGHYLDGRRPEPHPATVTLMVTGIQVATAEGVQQWRWEEIHQTQGFYAGEAVRLERGRGLAAAVVVNDAGFSRAVRATARSQPSDPFGSRRRRPGPALMIAVALGCVVVAMALYQWGLPVGARFVAELIPVSWEERMGGRIVETIGPERCRGAAAEAALASMVTRLTSVRDPIAYRFRVHVVDVPVVNAFALPGGHVVLLRGLLDAMASPDMLAFILAHELQHVLQRHATRSLIQQASIRVLLGAAGAEASGIVAWGIEGAGTLGALRYGRQAEEEADREAVRMLLDARVSTEGLLALFAKVEAAGPQVPAGVWSYLSTHPAPQARLAAARDVAAQVSAPPVAILSDEQWRAVKTMCGD